MGVEGLRWQWRAYGGCGVPERGTEALGGFGGLWMDVNGLEWVWRT